MSKDIIRVEEEIKPYEYPVYSDQELQEFDKQLEKYKTERELNGKKVRYLSVEGENQFLESMNCLSRYGGVIVTGFKYVFVKNKDGDYYYASCDPVNNYKIMTDKLEQWNKWKSHQEYGQKMQKEDYEQMASQLENHVTDF